MRVTVDQVTELNYQSHVQVSPVTYILPSNHTNLLSTVVLRSVSTHLPLSPEV